MSEEKVVERTSPVSARVIVTALAYGGAALVIVLADLTVPIPGTDVVTDPRELFTTLGAALSGPFGGVLIGVLAGVATPGFPLSSILAHVTGGVWMGIAYKKLVYDRLRTLVGLLAWAGIVLVYYYIFVIPGFIVGLALFYGKGAPFLPTYINVAKGVLPEALLTTGITAVAILALPGKHQRPLW